MIYQVSSSKNDETVVTVALAHAGTPFCERGHAGKMRFPRPRGRRQLAVLAAAAMLLLSAEAPAAFAQQAPADASQAQVPAPQSAPAPANSQQATPQADQTIQAPAAQPAPTRAPAPASYQPPSAPGAFSLLQTLFALCLVLAMLAGMAWLLKRLNPRGMGGNANLRVVSALSLGGRERVLVVEVGEQWIIVGAAPGRVNLLTTMPKQEGVVTPPGTVTGVPAGFADWLKQTLDKRNAK
jgi:flagellar protein FliO/FliZ